MYRTLWHSKRWFRFPEVCKRQLLTSSYIAAYELSPESNIWCLECKENASCLSREVMNDLQNTVHEIDIKSGDQCKGIVLFSRRSPLMPHFDYSELEKPARESFLHYWFIYQNMFRVLQTFPAPVCVVSSLPQSIETLCLLCACDFRVLELETPTLSSLQETVNLCSPWMAGAIAHILGFKTTEKILTGQCSVDKSKEMIMQKLPDATAKTVEEGIMCSANHIRQINKCPSLFPFWVSKDNFRKSTVAPLCTAELRQFDAECQYENLIRFSFCSTNESQEGDNEGTFK